MIRVANKEMLEDEYLFTFQLDAVLQRYTYKEWCKECMSCGCHRDFLNTYLVNQHTNISVSHCLFTSVYFALNWWHHLTSPNWSMNDSGCLLALMFVAPFLARTYSMAVVGCCTLVYVALVVPLATGYISAGTLLALAKRSVRRENGLYISLKAC